MPKQYSHGGRVNPRMGRPANLPVDGRAPRSLRQRFSALGNLKPFLRLIWEIQPAMTVGTVALRAVRALLPVATLYIGKLIIDEVVRLGRLSDTPHDLGAWLTSGVARP